MTNRTNRRSYQQFCGLARALDVVGERWTLLLVRELLLGPRRYTDLLEGLPGLTTNLLARRLSDLRELGLIEKVELGPPMRATAYELTPLGRELEPVVMALGRWGTRYLAAGPRAGDTVNVAWGLVSLKRRYRGGEELISELRIGERVFQLSLSPDYLDVREGGGQVPAVIAAGAPEAFRDLLFAGRSASALRAAGGLVVTGDEAAWARFVAGFGFSP